MLTRSKFKRGEGELVEANPEIGRVFSQKKMTEEHIFGSEAQFLDNFMTIRAMVEEMYNEFKKGKGEGTSSPKPDKELGEKPPPLPPPSPPSSPSLSSSSSSHKSSSSKKNKKKKSSLIKLDVNLICQFMMVNLTLKKLDNLIR